LLNNLQQNNRKADINPVWRIDEVETPWIEK